MCVSRLLSACFQVLTVSKKVVLIIPATPEKEKNLNTYNRKLWSIYWISGLRLIEVNWLPGTNYWLQSQDSLGWLSGILEASLVLVVYRTWQGSSKWLVCMYCVYKGMILSVVSVATDYWIIYWTAWRDYYQILGLDSL